MRTFDALVDQLNAASLRKGSVPLRDLDWEAPEHRLEAGDPRFALSPDHPLARTAWHRGLSPEVQAELGLTLLMQTLRYGIAFESALSRGLLEYTTTLPARSPAFRYALHEVIEESHHSMMFRELVNRSGVPTVGLAGLDAALEPSVIRAGRTFPELFFVAVWAGEAFIDHQNRQLLREGGGHPLVRQVMRIHVIEEARHLSFAQAFLRERLPRLGAVRRAALGLAVPFALSSTARVMLTPAP